MKKLFLLDAYALIYRAYYALISNPRINSKKQNTSAVFGFVNTLEEVLHKEQPTHIAVAFDPRGGTFRHKLYPPYKAQREETPEDIRWAVPVIKDFIRAYNIEILEVPGYEADDVIGTMATMAPAHGFDTYMMTPDKDYGQLVAPHVWIYKPPMGMKPLQILGSEDICAKYSIRSPRQVIDILGLMGDAVDNVPGCPGVGEKTAIKLLQTYSSIEDIYADPSQLKGKLKEKIMDNKEQVLLSKYLVTIKTDVPLDFDEDKLAVRPADTERLASLFRNLEFFSLLKKMNVAPGAAGAKSSGQSYVSDKNAARAAGSAPVSSNPQPVQLDLFGNPILLKGGGASATDGNPSAATPNPSVTNTEISDTVATPPLPPPSNLQNIQNAPAENPADDDQSAGNARTNDFEAADLSKVQVQVIDAEGAQAQKLAEIFARDSFAFEFVATSNRPLEAEICGLAIATSVDDLFYFPFASGLTGEGRVCSALKALFQNERILKICHDIKPQSQLLRKIGINVYSPFADTMLAHYVLQPELKHMLPLLAETLLHTSLPRAEEIFDSPVLKNGNFSLAKTAISSQYFAHRAQAIFALWPLLKNEMEKEQVLPFYVQTEAPLALVLADMEATGVKINTQSLEETSRLFTARMNEYEEKVHELSNSDFNISSPKQVGELLFDHLHLSDKPKKTKTGQYVTNEEVLESLRSAHPVVDYILKYRAMKKLLGTYIDALPKLINPHTGHIHSTFNQAITATGRLSSSDPNLQNIPVRGDDGKEIRKAFIPEDGQLFFSADYSQIELRVMAHLSQDPHMIEAFREGHDVHAATAAKIFHKNIADITPEERRKAKTANFGIIYGISAFGLAQRMGVSRTEARQLIDGYFNTYTHIRDFIEQTKEEAKKRGFIETISHRRRYIPDISSHNAVVRGYAERNAVNAPIQGSASDIIKIAMVRIFRRFREERIRSKMILQVHDELNFSVLPEEKERVGDIVKYEMENAYHLSVPLLADCGWGSNWLEAH